MNLQFGIHRENSLDTKTETGPHISNEELLLTLRRTKDNNLNTNSNEQLIQGNRI